MPSIRFVTIIVSYCLAASTLLACTAETTSPTHEDDAASQVDALTGLPATKAEQVMEILPTCGLCASSTSRVFLDRIVVINPLDVVGPTARPLVMATPQGTFRVTTTAKKFVAILPAGVHIPDGAEVRVRALTP